MCRSIAEIQRIPAASIELTCDSDPVILDLDTVTTLGIVLAELVTNSYDHAFPNGIGYIRVSVRAPQESEVMATMTIVDSGPGFNPATKSGRHGLGLLRRLVEQVRGTVALESRHRTSWTIRFPVAA